MFSSSTASSRQPAAGPFRYPLSEVLLTACGQFPIPRRPEAAPSVCADVCGRLNRRRRPWRARSLLRGWLTWPTSVFVRYQCHRLGPFVGLRSPELVVHNQDTARWHQCRLSVEMPHRYYKFPATVPVTLISTLSCG